MSNDITTTFHSSCTQNITTLKYGTNNVSTDNIDVVFSERLTVRCPEIILET